MSDIELVIRIPEEVYKSSKNGTLNEIQSMYICGSVVEGTPLPKGHGDLIDVGYLREDFKTSRKISFADRMDISCIVDHAPIIIEADKEES